MIKPCPFCGSDNLDLIPVDECSIERQIQIGCYDCGAGGPCVNVPINKPISGDMAAAAVPWGKLAIQPTPKKKPASRL